MSDNEMARGENSDLVNQFVMAMMESNFFLRLVNLEKRIDNLNKSFDNRNKSIDNLEEKVDERTKILKEFLHVSEVKKA